MKFSRQQLLFGIVLWDSLGSSQLEVIKPCPALKTKLWIPVLVSACSSV